MGKSKKNVLVGKFIGKDNSLGFKHGNTYHLKETIKSGLIILEDNYNSSLRCPYSSIGAVIKNWELLGKLNNEDWAEF